jgi:hypothetical protein
MRKPITDSAPASLDHLDDYVAGVSKLPGKLALIAAHQRGSELSLARAAAALRSMGALNRRNKELASGNARPKLENIDKAFC